MKTKAIVSGGFANEPNELNAQFFKEILKDTKDEVVVLLIVFSKPELEWDVKSRDVIQQFNRVGAARH